MFKQYQDFNVKKFTSTFNSNNVNGFDIMIMQSHKEADYLIEKIKKIIDSYQYSSNQVINIEYDDSQLLESDRKRVKQAIKKYALQKCN